MSYTSEEIEILSYLKKKPAVPGELEKELGISLDRVLYVLGSLEEQGIVQEIPDRTEIYYYLCYYDFD